MISHSSASLTFLSVVLAILFVICNSNSCSNTSIEATAQQTKAHIGPAHPTIQPTQPSPKKAEPPIAPITDGILAKAKDCEFLDQKLRDLKNGKEVNINEKNTSADNSTALHYAAVLRGDIDITKALLDRGADIDAQNKSESTPLHLAAKHGHQEIVELLIAKGAHINSVDISGWSALHWVIISSHKKIAAFLIEKGANLEIKDKLGRTALHSATITGHQEIVELLIEKGAGVNAQDDDGNTPLHYAAMNDNKEIAKILIDNRAHVDATDKAGLTPLQVARKINKCGNCDEVIPLLEKTEKIKTTTPHP